MKTKYFSHFFPTPEFLTMKSVGLSISDTMVRYIEFDSSYNRREVIKKGQHQLPKGIVNLGFINDISKLSDELKSIRKAVGSRFVSASIPDEKAYVYKTKISYSESEETIYDSVESTIESNVPLKLDQITFSFDILHNTPQGIDVVVSAVPTKVIDAYIDAFEGAEFVPVSFELESHAVACSVVPQNFKETSMVVHIDDMKTGFYVVREGLVQFSSSLEGHPTVERDSHVVVQNVGSKNLLDHAIAKDERNFIDVINDEIDKVYDYWKTHGGEGKKDPIKQIFVSGERAADERLIQQIDTGAPVQVEPANVWTNAFSFDQYIPDIPLKESLGFAAAVGLALSTLNHNTE